MRDRAMATLRAMRETTEAFACSRRVYICREDLGDDNERTRDGGNKEEEKRDAQKSVQSVLARGQ